MSLNIRTNIDGLKEFEKYIEFVEKISFLQTDKKFQRYIQDKFLETVNRISIERLPEGNLKQEYIQHNQIRETDTGFILYNDTTVSTENENYDGEFSIALAFEYGTGIVGQENPKLGAWDYNINNHEKGWIYFKDGSFHFTRGMEGQEIYRYTLEEIKRELPNWIRNY